MFLFSMSVTDLAELIQATLMIVDILDPFLSHAVSVLQSIPERLEVGVHLDNTFLNCQHFGSLPPCGHAGLTSPVVGRSSIGSLVERIG
jgi:hypothetical protein